MKYTAPLAIYDRYLNDPTRESAAEIRDAMAAHPEMAATIKRLTELAYFAGRADRAMEMRS